MLQPRLVTGEGNFKVRRTFYTGEGMGNISQINVGWPADREGADIAVVGSQGADFVDSSGQRKREGRFSIEQRCPVALARTGPAGEYGYLTREESWTAPATLFDKEGHVSWHSSGTWPGVDDSAAGDVFGDGRLSVAVGFNGAGGLALFDGQGKKLWDKLEANVWHVEMLDTNGDGRDEILHSNAKGQLLVRNGNGTLSLNIRQAGMFRILQSRAGGRIAPLSHSRSNHEAWRRLLQTSICHTGRRWEKDHGAGFAHG